jgi:hypothetical protein
VTENNERTESMDFLNPFAGNAIIHKVDCHLHRALRALSYGKHVNPFLRDRSIT